MTHAFTDETQVRTLLRVEVALAEAQAEVGVFPTTSADAIRIAADPSSFDVRALVEAAADAGNLAIPLVDALSTRVASLAPAAAGHVHLGATSQDVLDTALVLQLGHAVGAIDRALDTAGVAAARLAREHAATPMAGRTWLQQASAITFGLKAAGWLDAIDDARTRLAQALADARVVQLGGATGTLASLGVDGPRVVAAFAARLGLNVPPRPWHTGRERVAGVATALGIACGSMAKVARDVILLAQTEVGEVSERAAAGRGGSSAMPHKRNPVGAVRVVAAATQAPGLVATLLAAMAQEHERAAGGWQAEWRALPSLVSASADAADALAELLAGLNVHADRMRANLDLRGGVARAEGLVAALAPAVGRVEAMRVVKGACDRAIAGATTLAEAAASDAAISSVLDRTAIDRALDPASVVPACRVWIDRVLEAWKR